MSFAHRILRLWIPLAIITTGLAALVYVSVQQNLRMSANDPQIQIAEDSAHEIAGGGSLPTVPDDQVIDIRTSLSPFVIVFDDAGKPLLSTGRLSNIIPVPPAGVFDDVRVQGEGRFTWQPPSGIRIAAVVTRVSGARPGFVLAGRSLRETEIREQNLLSDTALCWITTLIATLAVIVYFEAKRKG